MEIRKCREKAGLTLTDVARAMNVDAAAVFRWESGEADPRANKLPRLADLFGCTIDELYGRNSAGQASA